jgi:hypothetical protein
MPPTSPDCSSLPKTELETVTRWPALLAAAMAGLLLLGVPLALIGVSALRSGPAAPESPPRRSLALALATSTPAELQESLDDVGSVGTSGETPASPVVVQLQELPPPQPVPPDPPATPVPPIRVVLRQREAKATPPEPLKLPEDALYLSAGVKVHHNPYEADLLRFGDYHSEASMLAELYRRATEVDLNAEEGTSGRVLKEAMEADRKRASANAKSRERQPAAHPLLALLPQRPDLAGLPARPAGECVLDEQAAHLMGDLSQYVRPMLAKVEGRPAEAQGFNSPGQQSMHMMELNQLLGERVQRGGLRTLVQMLQTQGPGIRLRLVEKAAPIPQPNEPNERQQLARRLKALEETATADSRDITAILAQRALFDLSAEVRKAAVDALLTRPRSLSRALLLQGLRYPWAPVANHAAEALIALGDLEALPALVGLLDEPDPSLPEENTNGKWVVTELVRVNHLRNCLLCHAPSFRREDCVRGLVPTPGQPLPVVYYESRQGTFVRADVTYLRQDFSVMHPVENAKPWPNVQRFDYLVRRRELTDTETAAHLASIAAAGRDAQPQSYPQREAVLFALRELTGMKLGESSLDWRLALLTSGIPTGP